MPLPFQEQSAPRRLDLPKRVFGLWSEKVSTDANGEALMTRPISGCRRKGITKSRANGWPGRVSLTNGISVSLSTWVKISGKFALGQGREENYARMPPSGCYRPLHTVHKGFKSDTRPQRYQQVRMLGLKGRRRQETVLGQAISQWHCLCSKKDKHDVMVTFPGSAKGHSGHWPPG